MASFTLAATGKDDTAGVICSFNAKWQDLLHAGVVHVVFRKKKLSGEAPPWLYIYLSSPVSAITAKAPIESFSVLPIAAALQQADQGKISVDELSGYAADSPELFVMQIGAVELAQNPVTNESLREEYSFFPSPNFIRVAKHGVEAIDRMGRFSPKN